jgi:hypothetical protein
MLVRKPSAGQSAGRRALEVAVIGAGSSGLAAVKAVRELIASFVREPAARTPATAASRHAPRRGVTWAVRSPEATS